MNRKGFPTYPAHTREGSILLVVVCALCAGPIACELGLLAVPHHDPDQFLALIVRLSGGNQYISVFLMWGIVSLGFSAPKLVPFSIVLAVVAVIKSVPRWIKIAIWLPILAALPAAVVVLRLGAEMAALNSHPPAIYAKNRTAYVTVRAISWCAIQYQQKHPDSGYPFALEDLNSFPCGNRWSVADLPGYRISYDPLRAADGQVTDFSLVAYPGESDPRFLAYESDRSGLLYVEERTQTSSSRRVVFPYSSTGDYSLADQKEYLLAAHLYDCLQLIARANPDRGYPRTLHEARSARNIEACRYPADARPTVEERDTGIRVGNYDYIYRLGTISESGRATAFELYAHCLAYGRACIRNVYANQDSELHVTTADRLATLDDAIEPLDDAIEPIQLVRKKP